MSAATAAAIAKLLWAACVVIVLGVAALHGRKWERKRRTQDAPRLRAPRADEGPVSRRVQSRSGRGWRQA